jgi:hypothetical protein
MAAPCAGSEWAAPVLGYGDAVPFAMQFAARQGGFVYLTIFNRTAPVSLALGSRNSQRPEECLQLGARGDGVEGGDAVDAL